MDSAAVFLVCEVITFLIINSNNTLRILIFILSITLFKLCEQTNKNMSKFTVIAALFVFIFNVWADNSYMPPPFIPVMTTGNNMPVGLRYPGSAGYSTNDSAFIYVLGGLQDGNAITNTVYRYNVLADSWSTLTNFPDGSCWISAAAVIGSKLYSLGGTYTTALNQCTPRVKIYDLNSNTWSNGADMPYGRVFHSVCTYQDSLLYCAGGWGYPSGAVYADVYLYNSISNTWRPASNMPAPRAGGVLGVSHDTLVYICGGTDWTNPAARNTVFRGIINQSDRSQITWDSTGAVYPGGVRNSIYGASWGNKGVIVSGGYQVTSVTNQVYVYSPGANTWTPQPNLPAAKTDHGAASVHIGNVWKFISSSGTSNRSGSNANTVYILTDTIDGLTGISGNISVPSVYELNQNYPNPFNPSTNIDFSIAGSNEQFVSLVIFDVMGRETEKLVYSNMKPGKYNVEWNASSKPSGTYFARLTAGDYTKTIKLLLIK